MKPKYLSKRRKLLKPAVFAGALCCLLLLCVVLAIRGRSHGETPDQTVLPQTEYRQPETTAVTEQKETETPVITQRLPWEADGAKQPEEYTLLEYEGLTAEQRKAFKDHLGADRYTAWLEQAEKEAEKVVEIPWKTAGTTQPIDYTWAEYQALTEAQKKAFMEALGPQGLEAWLKEVKGGNSTQSGGNTQNGGNTQSGSSNQSGNAGQSGSNNQSGNNSQDKTPFYPWEKAGAKKATEYTWEEYDALSLAQQKAFRSHLGTEGFKNWLKKAEAAVYPWKADGAKQPKDYTWEEYTALKEDQRKKFQAELGVAGFQQWQTKALSDTPWKADGAKQPEEYTWKEYESLSAGQQNAFQEHLGNASMKKWLQKITDIPWEKTDAKQPARYTLQEYEALEPAQQLAFRLNMGMEGFETWRTEAQNPVKPNPWEVAGAKQPQDYTLGEFNALTSAQQIAFQNHLGSKAFEAWMNKVQNKPPANPWEAAGAKQPKDYTLAEFEALTSAQQMAFQNYLGSAGFSQWLNKVQEKPADTPTESPEINPWEVTGAKQPADYTWEEFEALTAGQQMAFQNHLGTGAFETWMNRVQEAPLVNPWDAPSAKQPADYTWEEFEALTAGQQMAFQNHLGTGAFETWLNCVQEKPAEPPASNPWDSPDAKQPADYTWEEFEALTAGQQMAFQNYLGIEAFEIWLNQVMEMSEA